MNVGRRRRWSALRAATALREHTPASRDDGRTPSAVRLAFYGTIEAVLCLLCLLLILAPALPAAPSTLAQSGTSVRVRPAEIKVGEHGTSALEIHIDDVEALYAFDIRLSFDPTVVAVVDADAALGGIQVLPGDFLSLDFVARNEADNGEGTVWFALTQMNPTEAVSGSGTAFVVTLRGVQAGGRIPLTITRAQLVTRHGQEIPTGIQDGQILVVGPHEAPPQPTEAATRQPSLLTPTLSPTPQTREATPSPASAATPPPTTAPETTSRATPGPAAPTPGPVLDEAAQLVAEPGLGPTPAGSDTPSTPANSALEDTQARQALDGDGPPESLSETRVGADPAASPGAPPTAGPPGDTSAAGSGGEGAAEPGPARSQLFENPLTAAALGSLLLVSILGGLLVKPERRRRGTGGPPGAEAGR